jgi:radical SAM/Cys-rich protein
MAQETIIPGLEKEIRKGGFPVEPFSGALTRHGLELRRGAAYTLQVNVGLRCNQSCRHCHLEAGPDRNEVMSWETVEEVAGFARQGDFEVIDITGGAPELHPRITGIIARLAPLAKRTLFRSNLTALAENKREDIIEACREHGVVIVASFPSLDAGQSEVQRGKGVFSKSTLTLKWLNELGYGLPGSALELNLVSNPAGAFLATSQEQAERKFQRDLKAKWGIIFNHLYTFSNIPLGRFRSWLIQSSNFETYMQKLTASFNPHTLEGLMCRSLVSVNWEGFLFDCDFNLAAGIPMGGRIRHVSEMAGPPAAGEFIATGEHCYACTAGSGFTCGGAITA